MARQMCSECPFRQGTKGSRVRDKWAEVCKQEMIQGELPLDGSLAHGCHMLSDVSDTADPEIICIGHRNWLKGVEDV